MSDFKLKFQIMAMINSESTSLEAAKDLAAHYLIALARGSRAEGHDLTDLEGQLLDAAQSYLKSCSKTGNDISEKTAEVLAMRPKRMLAYINKARQRGHVIPDIVLKVEGSILSRGM